MKSAIKTLISLCVILSLGGCATYKEPPSSVHVSTIQGSIQRQSLKSWDATEILYIDGKRIGAHWRLSSKFRISPGEHQIMVKASFSRGFATGGPYYATIQLPINVMINNHYVVKSFPRNTKIKVWIENSRNNRKVSISKYQPYQMLPDSEVPLAITEY